MKSKLYTVTLILAAAPVVFGALLFAMLLLTRWEDLIRVAWYAFIPCLALVLASFICLLVFFWIEKGKATKRVVTNVWIFIGLAPIVVFGVFWAGVNVYNQFIMTVENASNSSITNLTFKVDDFTTTIPSVAPGQIIRRVYHFPPDGGRLDFTARVNGKEVSSWLMPDMSGQTPGRGRIVFPEKGHFEFDSVSRWDVL